MKYKVVYMFLNSYGIMKVDDLSDNGHGFTLDEANAVAADLMTRDGVLGAAVEEM